MKKLVYTISDLRESSIDCIDLLYKSLLLKNNSDDFDFFVITNNKEKVDMNILPWKLIYDDCVDVYVGWLKYSNKIPKNYDLYYYFDSDILCYESLDNLISDEFDFSFVYQNNKMSEDWFCYTLAPDFDKKNFINVSAINAGTYIIRDLSFLNDVKFYCNRFNFSETFSESHAKFEQSAFNYTIFKKNISSDKINNIRRLVELFPQEISDHTIYHFCGFDGSMDKKYIRMKHFDIKFREKVINDIIMKMI